jgi:membrane associated rhomboid family serine protease
MIPIGDENRGRRRTPIVLVLLLIANIGAFIYEISLSQGALQRLVLGWGVTPYEITNRVDLPPEIGAPIWVTIFTSMFLHGGWLHIGGNMLYLWIFGDNVEDAMGHIPFLLFYLLCGVGAAALQIMVNVDSQVPMIGASGALSGVMGAYLIRFPRRRVRVLVFLGIFVTVIALPALVVIGFWVLLQFMSGLATLGPETAQTDGVAYFAHIGGFLTGVALLLLWRKPISVARRRAARSWE